MKIPKIQTNPYQAEELQIETHYIYNMVIRIVHSRHITAV